MPGALASNFGELAKYDVGLFIQTEHGVHVYVLKGMQFVYERMVRAPQTLYLPNPILELDNLNTFIYFYNLFFFLPQVKTVPARKPFSFPFYHTGQNTTFLLYAGNDVEGGQLGGNARAYEAVYRP